LGYSVFSENKIVRGKSLSAHINIGSQKQKINITPDYLLKVGSNISWILDAKHPKENILDGKHREQAFSYAILPDVKAYYYALCNGKEIIVFHIAKTEPLINLCLADIDNELNPIINILSPKSIKKHYFTQQGDNMVLNFMDKMDELEMIAQQNEITGISSFKILQIMFEAIEVSKNVENNLSSDCKIECKKVINYARSLLNKSE
jgi:hypothetical protein